MTSNWPLKVLSVFLALTLWFVVSAPRRESTYDRAYAVPLTLVGMPRDLVITTPVPDTVSVRLRGRASDLRSLSSSNLEVPLDLRTVGPGDITITIRPQAVATTDSPAPRAKSAARSSMSTGGSVAIPSRSSATTAKP